MSGCDYDVMSMAFAGLKKVRAYLRSDSATPAIAPPVIVAWLRAVAALTPAPRKDIYLSEGLSKEPLGRCCSSASRLLNAHKRRAALELLICR